MKRMLTGLCLVLALCLSPAALAVDPLFPKAVEMPSFTDIAPTGTSGGAWYNYQSIKTTVEAGLMKGTGAAFEPSAMITMAEVAAIAARINAKTTNYPIPAQGADETWYAPFLAVMEHIGADIGSDPMAKATRSDFIRVLSAVLSDGMLAPINAITSLPDTKDADVLRFYNAGILQGKDIYGTFGGAEHLRRSDTAAMLARIIEPGLRITFTPAYSPDLPETPTPSPAPASLAPEGDHIE